MADTNASVLFTWANDDTLTEVESIRQRVIAWLTDHDIDARKVNLEVVLDGYSGGWPDVVFHSTPENIDLIQEAYDAESEDY